MNDKMPEQLKPVVQRTQYVVHDPRLPHGHRKHWSLWVCYDEAHDSWYVTDAFTGFSFSDVLNADGGWDWEDAVIRKREGWIEAHRFDEETAVRKAHAALKVLTRDGMTYEEHLQRFRAREQAEDQARS